MFKFLKKKHKRSDWMEGLLLAEQYKDYCIEEYAYRFDKPQFMCGVVDYLNHKKYLESLDK